MRNFLAKHIWLLGARYRNPSLLKIHAELRASEKSSKDVLMAKQEQRLFDLLEFADQYSTFYRDYFQRLNINVSDRSQGLEILKNIPPIDKNTVLEKRDDILSDFKFNKTFQAETSGSTGQSLKFVKDEFWDSSTRAAILRGYDWYGVSPWERNGYFWGYNFSALSRLKIGVLDLIQNRFRLFSFEDEDIIKFIRRTSKSTYLSGYSSMIYEIAKRVNAGGIKVAKQKLKLIKGTSEKIHSHYHEEVRKAFGQKVVSEYGAAETGIIAFECPMGKMHVVMENVIAEQLDGQIVVTNLVSKSFPIIRYQLGDSVTFAPSSFKCDCGSNHDVITEVNGRVGSVVLGQNSQYPSLTFYYVFKNLAIETGLELSYQARQSVKGKVEINIEQELSAEQIKLVHHQCTKYFKNDIDVRIRTGVTIHSMDGKLKDFVSTI